MRRYGNFIACFLEENRKIGDIIGIMGVNAPCPVSFNWEADAMKWLVPAICFCLLCSATSFAAPKEKPRKGNPSEQSVLDLTARLNTAAQADGNITDWNEGDGSKVGFQTLLSGEYEYDWTGPKDLSATVMSQYSAD